MATQCLTESRYPQMPQMQLPSGFSIVVDDVDGDREGEEDTSGDAAAADLVEVAQEAVEDLPGARCGCGSSHDHEDQDQDQDRGSRGPLEAQLCSERIRQIQVEAQSRKNEFAKLLEEHAQVVRRVKQMEQREHQLQMHHDEERSSKREEDRTSTSGI